MIRRMYVILYTRVISRRCILCFFARIDVKKCSHTSLEERLEEFPGKEEAEGGGIESCLK